MGYVNNSSVARQFSLGQPILGRYAPSPSGDLHLGNLRTALLAWLYARNAQGGFVMRVEDLDRVKKGSAERQLADLKTLGIDWDGPVLFQSERLHLYQEITDSLQEQGLIYECFCTRKEIQTAASAPHAAPGAYPGTCRHLSEAERQDRRRTRPGALRLRSSLSQYTVIDDNLGSFTGVVDDFVLVRNDGTPAYNLASVVDDHFQKVTQIVRGDDLLPSAPRQAYLANLLGFAAPRYRHVPLALNEAGQRLAKRDGAVTLTEITEEGHTNKDVLKLISASIPLAKIFRDGAERFPQTVQEMLEALTRSEPTTAAWVVNNDLWKEAKNV